MSAKQKIRVRLNQSASIQVLSASIQSCPDSIPGLKNLLVIIKSFRFHYKADEVTNRMVVLFTLFVDVTL